MESQLATVEKVNGAGVTDRKKQRKSSGEKDGITTVKSLKTRIKPQST